MDRFLTFEGEQPIFLDDFNFMQDAVKDTVTNVVRSIMRCDVPTCILYGCELTYEFDKASWTDGVVMLDGELLQVKAGTIKIDPYNDTYLYFNIVETYDQKGDRTFKNGVKHNCYQRRTATISESRDSGYYIDEISRLENYAGESRYQIYYRRDDTVMITADLLHIFGGGWYLRVSIKQTSTSSNQVSDIVPDTDVTRFVNQGLEAGTTYSVQYYMKKTGAMEMLPVIISIKRDDANRAYLSVSYPDTQSLPSGDAQIYCRLMDI